MSTDGFKANVWWVIAELCESTMATHGLLAVRFVSGDPIACATACEANRLAGHADKNTLADTQVWTLCHLLSASLSCVLLSSGTPQIFYTAYESVFKSLLHTLPSEVPFAQTVLQGEVGQPQEQQKEEHSLAAPLATADEALAELDKLGLLQGLHPNQVCMHGCFHHQSSNSQHCRDCFTGPLQAEVLRSICSDRVVLVQGPPGTGKTHVGVKIISFLVSLLRRARAQHASMGPILVVTYKNHALDEMLRKCVDSALWCGSSRVTETACGCSGNLDGQSPLRSTCCSACCRHPNLVRFGTRSQEPRLAPFAVKNQTLPPSSSAKASAARHAGLQHALQTLSSRIWNLVREQPDLPAHVHQLACAIGQNQVVMTKQPPSTNCYPGHDQQEQPHPTDLNMQDEEQDETAERPTLGRAQVQDESVLRSQTDMSKFFSCCSVPLLLPCPYLASSVSPIQPSTDSSAGATLSPLQDLMAQYATALRAYCRHCLLMQAEKDARRLQMLRSKDVIGLTSTACAMNQALIRSLKPSVLVVEEAAEILEPQLVACMGPSLRHVVQIGDHKQLQPPTESHHVALKTDLNISMFERLSMIGVPVRMLDRQHRMDPSISRLVSPIYNQRMSEDYVPTPIEEVLHAATAELHDDESVVNRLFMGSKGLPGFPQRVFFWHHQFPEKPRGTSQWNPAEVNMCLAIASHLSRGGVMSGQITLLSPYKAQVGALRDALRTRESGKLAAVHVSTVDRYQGDENDVVVLSLTRTKVATEFLRRENRMCVGLSRARHGLFILGNQHLLDQVPHWQSTLGLIRLAGQMVASDTEDPCCCPLPAYCSLHPSNAMPMSLDLKSGKVTSQSCSASCGQIHCAVPSHVCTKPCHIGDNALLCPLQCGMVMNCGHQCTRQCHTPALPLEAYFFKPHTDSTKSTIPTSGLLRLQGSPSCLPPFRRIVVLVLEKAWLHVFKIGLPHGKQGFREHLLHSLPLMPQSENPPGPAHLSLQQAISSLPSNSIITGWGLDASLTTADIFHPHVVDLQALYPVKQPLASVFQCFALKHVGPKAKASVWMGGPGGTDYHSILKASLGHKQIPPHLQAYMAISLLLCKLHMGPCHGVPCSFNCEDQVEKSRLTHGLCMSDITFDLSCSHKTKNGEVINHVQVIPCCAVTDQQPGQTQDQHHPDKCNVENSCTTCLCSIHMEPILIYSGVAVCQSCSPDTTETRQRRPLPAPCFSDSKHRRTDSAQTNHQALRRYSSDVHMGHAPHHHAVNWHAGHQHYNHFTQTQHQSRHHRSQQHQHVHHMSSVNSQGHPSFPAGGHGQRWKWQPHAGGNLSNKHPPTAGYNPKFDTRRNWI